MKTLITSPFIYFSGLLESDREVFLPFCFCVKLPIRLFEVFLFFSPTCTKYPAGSLESSPRTLQVFELGSVTNGILTELARTLVKTDTAPNLQENREKVHPPKRKGFSILECRGE